MSPKQASQFKNLFLRLSLCLCFVAQSVVNSQDSIGCLIVFSWYDVITSKNKQIIGCALSGVFFLKFSYFFDLPQYSNNLIILDRRRAIYFNNQKNHCISSLRKTCSFTNVDIIMYRYCFSHATTSS